MVKAKCGDVFIVPPGKRHAIRGGGNLDVHYIHLAPKFFEQYLDRMTELPTFLNLFEIEPLMRARGNTYRHLYLDESSLKKVTSIIESLEGMWQYDPVSKLMVEGYIIVILTMFCREYEKLQTIIGKNANNDKFFMDSISYVMKHYNKKLTIDDLAHAAGLSRTAYIKRFHDTTGKSPKQFIMNARITAAKKLLSSNYSISKIAEETGFYDAAHFMKAFQAATGMSPTEYRSAGLSGASQYKSIIS